ncbi:hypothetical protein EC968_008801 [Mortierella alpina]|nr:hypothetical protein EC968_008801 [Mortierella alpina]
MNGIGDSDSSSGGGAVQCWSRLKKESLFHEYKVQSNTNNEIYLEMKVEDLLLAMRSSSNASAVVMRMTGRSADAFLTFTITTEDHLGNSRPITQNVPIVKIMTADGANNTAVFTEPMIPTPEVHIMLPQLERLRHIAASYKNLSDYIVLSANLDGEMVFTTCDGSHQFNHTSDAAIESISAKYGTAEKAHVETRFVNLHNPLLNLSEEEEHPHRERLKHRPKEFASVMIRVSDLQKVLQSHYIKPQNVICSILHDHSVLFYVYLKDTNESTLTYFIPESAV